MTRIISGIWKYRYVMLDARLREEAEAVVVGVDAEVSSSHCVTIPIVPSVAMNAKASGMPAKLAATPENVVSAERTTRGVPSPDRRVRHQEAEQAADDRRDEADLDAVLERRRCSGSCFSSGTFVIVKPPSSPLKAPKSTCPAGRNRKRNA